MRTGGRMDRSNFHHRDLQREIGSTGLNDAFLVMRPSRTRRAVMAPTCSPLRSTRRRRAPSFLAASPLLGVKLPYPSGRPSASHDPLRTFQGQAGISGLGLEAPS